MRKRHAFIIREALLDVRHDWALKPGLRFSRFQARSTKEMNLYLKAYNREMDRLAFKTLAEARKELETHYESHRTDRDS